MAEAYLNRLGREIFSAESAGFDLRPPNPLVVEVMLEEGVDLSQKQAQTVFDAYRRGQAFQYVISVCSSDDEDNCPIFPGVHNNRFRVVFPDPSLLEGSREEQLMEVRKIRDDIKREIEVFLKWFAANGTGVPGPRWERA